MRKVSVLMAAMMLGGCGQWPGLSDAPQGPVEFRAAMGPRYSSAQRYVLKYLKNPEGMGFDSVRDFQMELVPEWDSFEFHCYGTQGDKTYYVEGTLVDEFKIQVFIHQKRLVTR